MATYHIAKGYDTSGTSLQDYLPGVTREALVEAFGSPNRYGYVDDDKGYDGEEWAFLGTGNELFTIYSRWGQYRIGGRGALVFDVPKGVQDFKEYVLHHIGAKRN